VISEVAANVGGWNGDEWLAGLELAVRLPRKMDSGGTRSSSLFGGGGWDWVAAPSPDCCTWLAGTLAGALALEDGAKFSFSFFSQSRGDAITRASPLDISVGDDVAGTFNAGAES